MLWTAALIVNNTIEIPWAIHQVFSCRKVLFLLTVLENCRSERENSPCEMTFGSRKVIIYYYLVLGIYISIWCQKPIKMFIIASRWSLIVVLLLKKYKTRMRAVCSFRAHGDWSEHERRVGRSRTLCLNTSRVFWSVPKSSKTAHSTTDKFSILYVANMFEYLWQCPQNKRQNYASFGKSERDISYFIKAFSSSVTVSCHLMPIESPADISDTWTHL